MYIIWDYKQESHGWVATLDLSLKDERNAKPNFRLILFEIAI
jgi:hypothetical protein